MCECVCVWGGCMCESVLYVCVCVKVCFNHRHVGVTVIVQAIIEIER